MRTFSQVATQGLLSRETDQIYIPLLTISHSSLSDPLRFSRDSVNTVSRGSLTALDATVNDYDATMSLNTLWGNPLLGTTGLNFPGNEILHYVDCPNGAMNGLTDFTIEFLIKPQTFAGAVVHSMLSASRSGDDDEVFIRMNTAGTGFTIDVRGTAVSSNTTLDFLDGQTWRVSVTRVSATGDVAFFVLAEGETTATAYGTGTAGTGALVVDANGLILGQDQDSVGGGFQAADSFKGFMDDVRIWSDIRTPNEIADNAFSPLIGNEANLNAYWGFNDGNSFNRMPFNIVLPGEPEDRPPTINLSIDNVDRAIVQTLRGLTTPPSIKLEIVLFSSPHVVELTLDDFELKSASYNNLTVVGEWNLERLRREPFPALRFDLTNAPGLVQ
jgi:hypothetical protein